MAKTLLQLQTSLAYRMMEDTVPSGTGELLRRKSFINEAYRSIMREHYWWFTEATDTFNSVAAQASYGTADGVPTDLRLILELRVSDRLYHPLSQDKGMSAITTPYNGYSESFFVFAGSIYFVPPITTSGTDAIAIKYYKTHTELSANTDTILIPDIYSDAIVAYAYARTIGGEGERGSSGDGFAEYAEIMKSMREEQNKYLFAIKSSNNSLEAEYP